MSCNQIDHPTSRREFLCSAGGGFGALAYAALTGRSLFAGTPENSVAAKIPQRRGKAKHVIWLFMEGGPSHLDLWDPKKNVPDNVRSAFQTIPTKIPGIHFTEILPRLAQLNDRYTLIRSMHYTPNGLFNHTAAIYQMMTGYTTD